MTIIKFDRSVKYQGTRYPAHVAFEVDDKDVYSLKKAGATVLAVQPETPVEEEEVVAEAEEAEQEQEEEEGESGLKEKLLEYTLPQLIEFAQERGIDLQGKTRKADIYNIIVASLN